jgi:segregation and condensation protein A
VEAAGTRAADPHTPQQLAFPFYRVKLEVFEGPLDLLLHLIKKNEVDIVDIPVARITEQYLQCLELMRELNLDIAGEFLVMAATLTLVKSRMLLPVDEEEPEEEPDPRAQLVQQLLEYQRFREAALELGERPLLQRDVFAREPALDDPAASASVPEQHLQVSVWELLEAFRSVLQRARPDTVHEVVTEPVSLRERAHTLLTALGTARCIAFDSLFGPEATRLEVIVTFLALLELAKIGALRATQADRFGQIVVELAVEDISTVSFLGMDEYEQQPAGTAGQTEHGHRPNE